jgi:hypothetical protein
MAQIAELIHSSGIALPMPTVEVPATYEPDIRIITAASLRNSHSNKQILKLAAMPISLL